MILVCKSQFGHFAPGDEVEAPDGAVFDASYFELKASDESEKDDFEDEDE